MLCAKTQHTVGIYILSSPVVYLSINQGYIEDGAAMYILNTNMFM